MPSAIVGGLGATQPVPIAQGGTGSSTQNFVDLTQAQSVDGVKTFTSFPVTPSSSPTTNYQVSNKQYVDSVAGGYTKMSVVSFTGNGAAKAVPHGLGITPKFAHFLSVSVTANPGFWATGMGTGLHSLGTISAIVGTVDSTNFNFTGGDGQNNVNTLAYLGIFFA